MSELGGHFNRPGAHPLIEFLSGMLSFPAIADWGMGNFFAELKRRDIYAGYCLAYPGGN